MGARNAPGEEQGVHLGCQLLPFSAGQVDIVDGQGQGAQTRFLHQPLAQVVTERGFARALRTINAHQQRAACTRTVRSQLHGHRVEPAPGLVEIVCRQHLLLQKSCAPVRSCLFWLPVCTQCTAGGVPAFIRV